MWFEDLANLAEAATAVAGLGDGLEVAEEVHAIRCFRRSLGGGGRSDDQMTR
jgi:hypothetical protein